VESRIAGRRRAPDASVPTSCWWRSPRNSRPPRFARPTQLGLRDFGENYVQEFDAKRVELADCPGARYHFIGHLQSNKSKKAAEIFDVIHTVDSAKLARRLDRRRRRRRAGPLASRC
jgi:uncharacterized pyridoxal phosphate-containing UPF0001 family protein